MDGATMNYSFVLPFEKDYDVMPTTYLFQRYWTVTLLISALYLAAIRSGVRLMALAPWQLELRAPLFLWNCFFAVFSLMGALRMLPELVFVLRRHGFEYSVCNASFATLDVTGFWTECFAWSKLVELGDTAFLVLRRRPIIFLHWYHHITVLLYTWHACKDHTAAGRWFVGMNYAVHAVMYAYYAVRAAGVRRVPKVVPVSITTAQLSQMLVGIYVVWRVWAAKGAGRPCVQTNENLWLCLFMYFSYAVLFANYFVRTYLSAARGTPSAKPVAPLKNGYVNHDKFH